MNPVTHCRIPTTENKKLLNVRVLRRLLMVVIIACSTQAPLAQSALLSLQPALAFAGNGESVSVDLVVGGLGEFAPDSLGAFDANLVFDDGALSFSGYTLGALLGDVGLAEAIDASGGAAGGTLNIAEISLLAAAALDALQPAEFVLATLTFDVIDLAIGAQTQISILRDSLLADANGRALELTGVRSATVEGRAPVPAPATLALLLTGLLCSRITLRRSR